METGEKPTPIDAHQVKALIAQRYEAVRSNRRALFFELRSGTGSGATQSLDAFVIDTWPSSGFTRYAFEIKVNRADFLHELAQPAKRQWGMSISNEFWFVCPADVAKPEEIPETCGFLMVSKNAKMLRKVVQAKHRESEDLDMLQIAAILRAAADMIKYPGELRWLHEGKEIDGAALDELVAAERDRADNREIERLAEEKAKEIDAARIGSMNQYAEVMRAAGMEPPQFMTDPKFDGWTEYQVRQWVTANLVLGPDHRQIVNMMGNLKTAGHAIDGAREYLEKIIERKENGETDIQTRIQ